MATTFFLRDTTQTGVTISGIGHMKQLSTSRGASALSGTTTATASGDHIVLHDNADFTAVWLFQVAAVTISGTVTVNLWGLEDAMTTNAQLAVIISRYDSGGTFVSDVVAQANANHAKGVELGTAAAVQNWTATPTSTTFSDGDWLGVVCHSDAIGVMAVGNVTFSIDGPTGAANGDTFVTFTETIVAGTPPARVPYRNPMPSLLTQ